MDLFTPRTDTMRSPFAQQHHLEVLSAFRLSKIIFDTTAIIGASAHSWVVAQSVVNWSANFFFSFSRTAAVVSQ